jgi:glucose dehydrogenase
VVRADKPPQLGGPLFSVCAAPATNWRAYGRTQFGQRYSPLTQITAANAGQDRQPLRAGSPHGAPDRAGARATCAAGQLPLRPKRQVGERLCRRYMVDGSGALLTWGATIFDRLACRIQFHRLRKEGTFTLATRQARRPSNTASSLG